MTTADDSRSAATGSAAAEGARSRSHAMRIGIDARWLTPVMSGIGVYARELVRHVVPIAPDDEFVLWFSDPAMRELVAGDPVLRSAGNVVTRLVPWGVHSVLSQLRFPGELVRAAIDVFHSPAAMLPFAAFPARGARRAACVVTVHDVLPLAEPDSVPRSKKRRLLPLYRRLLVEVGARADAILCPSRFSRDETILHLRIPAHRAHVVRAAPNGVAGRFFAADGGHRSGSDRRTVLTVGRADPYKNLLGLVEAFGIVRAARPGGWRLRIVGPPDPRYPEPAARARELSLEGDIEWAGYLSDEALLEAYRSASVFVLPSRYEGFGLPVLEAMACGTPVVCGRRASLPEVAGDAAVLVDTEDPRALAEGILGVVEDPALAAHLAERGRARARLFTWERTARETLAAYHEAAAAARDRR